jgi:hypothetical protein
VQQEVCSVEVYRITRSNGVELVFEGVVESSAQGDPQDQVARGRWHELAVYRRSDNAWVVCIQYRTTWEDEHENLEVEVVDDAAEVESLLFSYEPSEHLNRRLMASLPLEDRKRVSRRVWTNYLDLANRVLDDLAPFFSPSAPEEDSPALPKPQDMK